MLCISGNVLYLVGLHKCFVGYLIGFFSDVFLIIYYLMLLMLKTSNRSLTTVVRAQNDTSKTANIIDAIFSRKR